MINIIDWILDLFRSEDAARAFVAAPDATLRAAGLAGVNAAQMSSVAATAVPGLVLGDGDPVVGLQRAVSNHYGFAPATESSYQSNFASPTYAPSANFAPETNADLLSHNDTSLLSPDQAAGANAQQGALNFGFGDIILGGSKTTTNTTANGDGAVAVGGSTHGDIVSGDGAVLGNGNEVNNGDVLAGTGSNVAIGHSTVDDNGTTATGGSSVISGNSGTVLHDVDASGGNGGGASAGSGGGLIGIGGSHSEGGNAGGGGIVINDMSSTSNSGNTVDSSVHAQTETHSSTATSVADNSDSSVHQSYATEETTVTDNSSQHSASLFDNSHDTSLTNSALDNSHDLSLASANHGLF
ncbi:MAG: hypothetical protein HYZ38_12715 [Mycobacterium sp.]|nr:hypothetical protein [Mycobacterium sp.]